MRTTLKSTNVRRCCVLDAGIWPLEHKSQDLTSGFHHLLSGRQVCRHVYRLRDGSCFQKCHNVRLESTWNLEIQSPLLGFSLQVEWADPESLKEQRSQAG